MNNLWKIHSVGGFYQNIVSIFDDVRYSLDKAFIICKPECLCIRTFGRFFYQRACQITDSTDKIYILFGCVCTDFCMKCLCSSPILPRTATLRPIAMLRTSMEAFMEIGLAL